MTTQIYHYDAKTGEYLGEAEAMVCPKTGVDLLPAHATVEAPSVRAGKGEALVFQGQSWHVITDYRGFVFYTPDGEAREILELGQVPDEGWMREPLPYVPTYVDKRVEAYLDKGWLSAFDVIDDILVRGEDVIKVERAEIKAMFPKEGGDAV